VCKVCSVAKGRSAVVPGIPSFSFSSAPGRSQCPSRTFRERVTPHHATPKLFAQKGARTRRRQRTAPSSTRLPNQRYVRFLRRYRAQGAARPSKRYQEAPGQEAQPAGTGSRVGRVRRGQAVESPDQQEARRSWRCVQRRAKRGRIASAQVRTAVAKQAAAQQSRPPARAPAATSAAQNRPPVEKYIQKMSNEQRYVSMLRAIGTTHRMRGEKVWQSHTPGPAQPVYASFRSSKVLPTKVRSRGGRRQMLVAYSQHSCMRGEAVAVAPTRRSQASAVSSTRWVYVARQMQTTRREIGTGV